jgi:hypothetical protein
MEIIEKKALVSEIEFGLEDYGQTFTFFYSGEFGTARLQLPTTPDSINEIAIDGNALDVDDENYKTIYEVLRDHFYNAFNSKECAKASALLGQHVNSIVEVKSFYVAFTESGSAHVLKEGRLSNYYNVFHFDNTDASDFENDDKASIIKTAEKNV